MPYLESTFLIAGASSFLSCCETYAILYSLCLPKLFA
jgi:hypothetical protein